MNFLKTNGFFRCISVRKSLKIQSACDKMALNAMKKKSNLFFLGQRGRAVGCKRACAKFRRSSLWSGEAELFSVGFDGAAPLQAYEGVLAPKLGGTARFLRSPHVFSMGRAFFMRPNRKTENNEMKGQWKPWASEKTFPSCV